VSLYDRRERDSSVAIKDDNRAAVAEAVRAACVDAAIEAYEDAGIRGLCDEGRWECAIAAIRRLDVQSVTGLPDAIAASTNSIRTAPKE
jgi:hypothetical protein